MHFEGSESFQLERKQLWAVVTNTSLMATAVPHLHKLDETSDDTIRCRVRPGFHFLTGTIKLDFHYVESSEPESVRLTVNARPLGGSMATDVRILLHERGQGTRVDWVARAGERTGLLRPISASLIRSAAERTIQQLWENLHRITDRQDSGTSQR